MIDNVHEEDRASLNMLMNEADLFVKYAMQTKGAVPPSLFIHGVNGTVIFGPKEFSDERSKDRFANLAKLMCIANGADATVFVSEAWLKKAKQGERLDLSKRPSQYRDRQETVVMMGQTRTACQQRLLPMIRSEQGKFPGFGNDQQINADRFEGRFANLIPEKYPDAGERELAKEALRRLGVDIERRKMARDEGEERGRGMAMS